jgi:glycosyltransferase involved in cell wall biosynthesis
MKISVAIPAYNCARTIGMALDSVLAQTRRADEILVVDDGSIDETASILDSYRPHATILSQQNSGTAVARNVLCERAQGDLVAFLDSDDLWHPEYLETQAGLFEAHPRAAAFFTGHVDLFGYGTVPWVRDPDADAQVEVIASLDFIKCYNARPGPFNMSFCCVSKAVLNSIGRHPFNGATASSRPWAEDCYFHNRLALGGPVVYFSRKLAAYRLNPGSLSWDQLKWTEAQMTALEQLVNLGRTLEKSYRNAFRAILSSKRRTHAKILLGAGKVSEARSEFLTSIFQKLLDPVSIAKSATLLLVSYLPRVIQPKWPPMYREYKEPPATVSAPRTSGASQTF